MNFFSILLLIVTITVTLTAAEYGEQGSTNNENCPKACVRIGEPVCGYNAYRGDYMWFGNQCSMESHNCDLNKDTNGQYERVDKEACYVY